MKNVKNLILFLFYYQIFFGNSQKKILTLKCNELFESKYHVCKVVNTNKQCSFYCDLDDSCFEQTEIYGTGLYEEKSMACAAALHDGSISMGTRNNRLTVQLNTRNQPAYASIRNGIKSQGWYNFNQNFYFISGRIVEDILDIAILHQHFIGDEHRLKNGKVECFVEPYNSGVIFKEFPLGIKLESEWKNYRYVLTSKINKTYPAISCTTETSILSRTVTFPVLNEFGAATSFLTKTSNINDNNLEISLIKPSDNNIWYKDDFNLNDDGRDDTLGRSYEKYSHKLLVKNVELYHDGIYHLNENYYSVATRLIVRVCRQNTYGPNCEHNCPDCFNGGICHDITGICICPPGYKGTNCMEVCPRNRFGRSCSFKCDEYDSLEGCKGLLICLPDPFGCTCGLGFGGIYCTEVCQDRFYGAGCKETCGHCAHNTLCDQITGVCPKGCIMGKKELFCKTDRPLLRDAPTECNSNQNYICINWKSWDETYDIGTGTVKAYIIKYKNVDFQAEKVIPAYTSTYNISGLNHSTNYEISIAIEDEISRENIFSPSINISTKCKVPSKGPDNLQITNHQNNSQYYMLISWNKIDHVSEICLKKIKYKIQIFSNGKTLFRNNSSNTQVRHVVTGQEICTRYCIKVCFLLNGENSTWSYLNQHWFTLPISNLIFKEDNGNFEFSWTNYSILGHCSFIYEMELTLLKSIHCIQEITSIKTISNIINARVSMQDLQASSVYKVNITTINNSGRSFFIKNITTSEKKPSGEPQKFFQMTKNVTTISFKWLPPNCLHMNGNITNYSIIINENGINHTFVHTHLENLEMTIFDLKPNSSNTIYISAINKNGTGPPLIYRFSTYPHKEESSNIVNNILLGLGICLLIVVIIIVVIILYRKLSKKRLLQPSLPSNNICLQETNNQTSAQLLINPDFKSNTANLRNADDILLKDLMAYSNEMKICNGFVVKYSNVQPAGQYAPWDVAKIPQNKRKNRYANIIAYDHSRVVLPILGNDENSDYINANYINGFKQKKTYIATQGPSETTFIDFWRMIWHENIEKIIMLCQLIEGGRVKCDQYWPKEYSEDYGEISVSLLKSEVFTNYTIRTMVIKKKNEDINEREITQFHFTSWPDHGVPLNAIELISFYKKTNVLCYKEKYPILIHCSAGVGRTGTFILMDILVKQARAQNLINVDHYLSNIRKDRINMVQTVDQYIFLHDAVIEAIQARNTNYFCQDFIEKFVKIVKAETTEQFNVLNDMKPIIHEKDLTTGNLEENKDKNRDPKIIPPNYARPYLMTFNGEIANNYINGVYINGYRKKNAFIVTHMPLPPGVNDFWRMIYDHKSRCIVMLNQINHSNTLPYWPKTGFKLYDIFKIEFIASESHDNIIIQTFKISNSLKFEEPPKTIKHFYVQNFEEKNFISVATENLINLSDMVERWQQKTENQPITIHCLNGVNWSGIFCAFLNIRERILTEQEIDIFIDVKQIRNNRPQFIISLDQYKLLHEMSRAFINTFEMYANLK